MADAPARPTRSLSGRVAIVTGAGSAGEGIGNGRAAAILLAEAGCNVVCVDLNTSFAQKTADMIHVDGFGKAFAIMADITKEGACRSIVERTVKEYGRLDILVNNVGIMGAKGTAVDVEMEEWEKGLRINVGSMVMMAKYAIPQMLKNEGQWRGSIVNLGSVAGIRGGTPSLLYPTAKGAVVNMTRAMADHHAADGIRVNCVCPGMLYTPMMYAGGMSDEQRAARKERSLLKTEGNGWDCGAAVRFLAGDEAR
jgi:NAD(P)-dependent dehydrogenase (short-subunit alcohol dehydrogenase family)